MPPKSTKQQRANFNVNVSKMSDKELRDLQRQAAVGLAQKAAKRVEELRAEYASVIDQMTALGAEYGITLNKLLASTPAQVLAAMTDYATEGAESPGGTVKPKHQVVPPKYRNPANHAQTWTGRGNRPTWVIDWLSSHPGGKMSELLSPLPVKSRR